MKDITFKQFIISTVILFVTVGIIIGIFITKIYYNKQQQLIYQYIDITEQMLDEIDKIHNISDTICETDIYEEYVNLKNELK